MTSKMIVPSQPVHRTITLNGNENPPGIRAISHTEILENRPLFQMSGGGDLPYPFGTEAGAQKGGDKSQGKEPF